MPVGQGQEVGPDALDIAVRLDGARSPGEHRRRRRGLVAADGPAHGIGGDQTGQGDQIVPGQAPARIVAVKVKEKGIDRLHLEARQLAEGLGELRVGLLAEHDRTIVVGTGTEIAGQRLGAGILDPVRPGMDPEHRVFLSLLRDLAGPEGQVMADEGLEMVFPAVAFEAAFDRIQMIVVEPFLAVPVERHQDEVADHVGAAQVAAAGVHGLEDAVRVVLPLLEVEGDDAELAEPRAQRRDIGAQLLDPFLEEREGLEDAGRGVGGPGPVMDQRQQRLRIPRLEQQPVVLVRLAEGIEEIVVPDLGGLEAVRRRIVPQVPGQGLEDQADGGQALLAVIDQIGRPVGVEGIDGGEIHHRTEEVFAHVGALAGVEDVLPELAAFPLGPGETALVDGDAELGRLPDEVEEKGF